MSLKLLVVLLCSICLVLSESPGTRDGRSKKQEKQEKQEKEKEDVSTNYGPLIEKIQHELNRMDLDEISKYGIEIENAKKELIRINDKLKVFENENHLDLTNDAVNKLSSRIEKIESDTSSSSMNREINDNTKRIEFIEENLAETDLEGIKSEIKQLSEVFEASTKRYDNTFNQIKERFKKIEKTMTEYNKNLQIVYDSTVGAAVDKLIRKSLDYLADVGEFCVNQIENIINKIQSIDWKYYYQKLTDPKQHKLFREWIVSVAKYCQFWWFNGIQPAIIRQATNLYFGTQIVAKNTIKFIHSHVLYQEMMKQSIPYLEMANIPREYNAYFVDGLLVLFVLSSLMTLSFIFGLCCDCCCPRKPLEPTENYHDVDKQTVTQKSQNKLQNKLQNKSQKHKKGKKSRK